jgi:hypothetical protein
MSASAEFETIINTHLQGLAASDPLFAETFKKPGKNIKDCVTYIMNTVRKSGRNWVPDDEVFGMAVHYYDEDKIDIGGPVSAKVSTSSNKLGPNPTKEETRRNGQNQPAPIVKAKKAEKPPVKVAASLFDM